MSCSRNVTVKVVSQTIKVALCSRILFISLYITDQLNQPNERAEILQQYLFTSKSTVVFETKNAWQNPACSPPGANAPAKVRGYTGY